MQGGAARGSSTQPRRTLAPPWLSWRSLPSPCAALVLVFSTLLPAFAADNSVFATADTYLKSGSPNKNQGTETILRTQDLGNNRALVRFDPAAIATAVGASTLTRARLRLHIVFNANNWGTNGRAVAVHRMLQAWTELGATWNCPDDTNTGNGTPDCTPWVMTDSSQYPFLITPTDVIAHENNQLGPVEWDVTADVQAFLEGATHHGWLIKKTDEAESGKVEYSSREGAIVPELILTLDEPAPPAEPKLLDTFLREGAPNKSLGSELFLRIKDAGNNRALIAFDQAELESNVGGQTLVSAKLRLTIIFNADNWGTGREVAVHRMLQGWTEVGATWNCADDLNIENASPDCPVMAWDMTSSANWPFDPAPTATILHSNAQTGVVEWDVTPDVQAFLAGTVNHGWLVKKLDESQPGHVEYSSREGASPPQLVLELSGDAPPVVTVTSPANGSFTNTTPITVTGVVNEQATVTVNGQPATVTPGPSGTFLFSREGVALVEGPNPITVTATDTASNTSTVTITVTLDTAAPADPDLDRIDISDPDANGQVTVTGQDGAVEAGATVTITNTRTGASVTVTANANGAFTAQLAGQRGDTYNIRVTDAAGNTSQAGQLFSNLPPVLAPIGNRTAPVGQTLSFTLSATDPEGDALFFGATPLPLPANATLNNTTGEFRFVPAANQVGSFTLTFNVSDGLALDTETIMITVPAVDPGGDTSFSGRLLDANDAENGVTTPIVGATVSFLGTGRSSVSDAQGNFTISALPAGVQVFDIAPAAANPAPNGAPYAGFREKVTLQLHVDNIVTRPFFLPRIAVNSLTTIDPNATTVVTNPDLGISITVPPHTAKDQNGNDFTGQLSISLVPRGFAPAELPEFLDPDLLVTIQPVGVTFATPVAATAVNAEGFAPGNEVDFWSLDPNTGTFGVVGTGIVSPDGSQITTLSGGIRAADWHCIRGCPPGPGPLPFGDGPPPPQCQLFGSTVEPSDGCLGTGFSLPPYVSLGTSRSLTLSYKSAHAFPQPVIPFDATIFLRSAVPQRLSYRASIGDVEQAGETFVNTSSFNENIDETLRAAVRLDARDLPTGVYPHRIRIISNYPSARIGASIDGRTTVVNRRASPFGAGWSLTQLARLHPQPDGNVLIIDGDGRASRFRPAFLLPDVSRTGAVVVAAPPLSVVQGSTESNTEIKAFAERFNHVLPVAVNTNITAPGTYFVGAALTPGPVPAGTVINSYFVHFDPVGSAAINRRAVGSVTFPQEILGLVVLDATIEASDATLGAADTLYSNELSHGVDLTLAGSVDRMTLSADRRTITLDLTASTQTDHFRVITVGTPAPSPGDFLPPPGDFSRLAKNLAGTWTRTLKDGTQVNFDAQGLQTSVIDRNGNPTSYTYDGLGRLITITDPVGLVTLLDYAGAHLSQVTDPAGRVTRFDHDGAGNLTQVTFSDGSTRGFGYDVNHLMTSETNARGFTTTREYDSTGRVIRTTLPDSTVRSATNVETVGLVDPASGLGTAANPSPVVRPEQAVSVITEGEGGATTFEVGVLRAVTKRTDANGLVTEFTRDANANPTITTRPSGAVLTQTYDAAGNVLTATEQFNGATTTSTYDPTFNLVTTITDPLSRVTTFNRDTQGNVTQQINAAGHSTTMSYDSRGLLTQMTGPNGLVMTNSYDTLGRLTTLTETPPAGGGAPRTTTFAYDAAGQLSQVNRPDGTVLTMVYDPMGRLTQVTDNLNNRIAYDYDDAGNRIKTDVIDPSGTLATTLSATFDTRDRQVSTSAPHSGGQSSATQFGFDRNNNLTAQTDPNGNPSTRAYDPGNRLIAQLDALNGSTGFSYDANDQITQVVAPNGATTTYTYDLLGRRLTEASPDRGNLGFTYDLANNLKTVTDARGVTATYSYDALNRITAITYPDPAENITFTYDTCAFGTGRLCAQSDASGTYTYSYDAFGNITQVSYATLGVSYTTSYTYDAGNNVTSMTLPSGRTVTFTRDALRRIQAIGAPVNGTTTTLVSGITYRADQQVTARTFGNGLTDTRSYDQQGRLTSQMLGGLFLFGYSYDANGNVLVRAARSYQYDALDRLTQESEGTPISYGYDANGNSLTKVEGTLTTSYAYNTGSNQLASIDTTTLAYDAAGNLITDEQGRTYTYNNVGRLSEVKQGTNTLATYVYNAQGQRTRKVTPSGTTVYHYDLAGNLMSETTGTGAPIRDYVWQDETPIAQINVDMGSDTVLFLHADHSATPRLATNSTGTAVWRWEGQAFGATPPNQDVDGDGQTVVVNLRFPGQHFDTETQLHYNWNRYYDPNSGRYITTDPNEFTGAIFVPQELLVGIPGISSADTIVAFEGVGGSTNPYAYVDSNPLRWVDLNGRRKGKERACAILRLAVVISCKAPTRCSAGDSCPVLRFKMATKRFCILAQTTLTRTCFPDSPTHKQRIEDEKRGLARCQRIFDQNCVCQQ